MSPNLSMAERADVSLHVEAGDSFGRVGGDGGGSNSPSRRQPS